MNGKFNYQKKNAFLGYFFRYESKIRATFFAIALIPLSLFSLKPIFASDVAESIFSKHAPNIVYLETKLGTGTGFFLTEKLIVTNRHVVFGKDTESGKWNAPKKIYLRDQRVIKEYEFLACSKRVDLCIIGLHKGLQGSFRAQLPQRNVRVGEDIFIIGHPQGIGIQIISTGIISSEITNMPGRDYDGQAIEYVGFTTNAAISPGSSGSPVISKSGEILGIAVGIMKDSQNLNVIISASELSGLLNELIKNQKDKTFSLKPGFELAFEKLEKEDQSKAELAKRIVSKAKSNTLKPLLASETKEESQVKEETETLGSMDPDIIRRILLDHLPLFSNCYQKHIDQSGQAPSGVIRLDFTIGASGHVIGAGTESAEGLPSEVKDCVLSVLKNIVFPEPLGGGTVEVKQPMNFYTKSP